MIFLHNRIIEYIAQNKQSKTTPISSSYPPPYPFILPSFIYSPTPLSLNPPILDLLPFHIPLSSHPSSTPPPYLSILPSFIYSPPSFSILPSFIYSPCNLFRCYNLVSFSNLNSSLAKTQGSLYVHTGKRLI